MKSLIQLAYESVLDFPKEGLCQDIWENTKDGQWRMLPQVQEKLLSVAKIVCDEAKVDFERTRVYITGSITSNTFTPTADIDMHFRLLYTIREPDEITQSRFRQAFDRVKENYASEGLKGDEALAVAGHPIEVYYQPDEYQDYMSVGCFDIKTGEWLVGPELKDPSYDPYSELYQDIKKKSERLIDGIRTAVMKAYECAVVFQKVDANSQDKDTKQSAFSDFRTALQEAVEIYDKARAMRKVYSSPQSAEQAKKYRSSKKWKVADATFKLMDKFGYLAILKQYKEALEKVDTGDNVLSAEAAQAVLDAAKEYISNEDKLAEQETNESALIVTKTKQLVESFAKKHMKHMLRKQAMLESLEGGAPSKFSPQAFLDAARENGIDCTSAEQTKPSKYLPVSTSVQVFGDFPDRIPLDHLIFNWNPETDEFASRGWYQGIRCRNKWNGIIVDKVLSKLYPDGIEPLALAVNESLPKKFDAQEYVKDFKDFFGYQDDYMPDKSYSKEMDSLAAECALRMPTDTAAREIEGDAVMLLVLSGEEDAVEAGKKLGDCMMDKGKHSEETLLKRMSDAYIALQDLWAKYEREAEEQKKLAAEAVKREFKGKLMLVAEGWKPEYDDKPVNQWGEKWTKLPSSHYAVRCIDNIAKDCQLDPDNYGPKIDSLNVSSVHAFSDGRLLVTVHGGANGGQMPGECNFKIYLAIVKKFIKKLLDSQYFEDAWLVDWENDCSDDVWTLRFCLTFTEQQLERFKERTELPVNSDDRSRMMNENIGKPIALATIISFMAIPGLLPKSALAAELKDKPVAKMTVNSPEVKKAVSKSAAKSYNNMNAANIANAVARTIFAEAQSEGKEGQDAVASVIWNRAGGKAQNLIPVISKRKQFSCWNKYAGGWTDETYKYKIPASVFVLPKSKETWDNCMLLASKLVSEEFTSTIGNRNSYMNKKTASKKNVDSWGKSLDLDIGKHSFGYFAYNDGFKKNNAMKANASSNTSTRKPANKNSDKSKSLKNTSKHSG